ncbi:MAG TPA: phenylalanine--tRNA ligase subunit beta [Candidatus Cybelea sp.]|jgi:phenylalanyl-tRNA synthetase beta chain|nr:phenylalanine--tRNA ligase subunit beta [Candidatus Cybelea sp.]
MRVPISWLREFAALPDDVEEIAERLAMLGFPVAEIERRPAIAGVVTGRIVSLEKHPNADRLQIAHVDVAGGNGLTIATAADNVATGQTIAVATVGAQLPQLRIERRTMRGVVSEGMLISADELALPPEWFEDGIMQLDAGVPLGADAVELFGLRTDVLDVEITGNRPDSMSITGLARELAASYGLPLRLPSFDNPGTPTEPPGETPHVALESPDCYRFVAQRFDGVRVGTAPAWMRIRLALAGQRPINNFVDVSNYVMLETGQPLHFYDASAIGGGTLVVRSARDGETIVTLDGVTRKLCAQALVIADEKRPLCLAGLMGAAAGEVNAQTRAIVLEAANFNGARVRRMAKALTLRTEASARHEKSLAPVLTDIGAARAAQLLCNFGATAYRPHAFGADVAPAQPIALPVRDVERLLGSAIPADRIEHHLTALGCTVAPAARDALSVTPPLWRRDLTIPADLVEEVARIEGYDRIEAIVPSVPPHEISGAAFDLERRIAHGLAALGYHEVITYSLHGAGRFERFARAGLTPHQAPIEVRNPLSEEQRFLRDSLLPGLLEYFAANEPLRVFEIGDIFHTEQDRIVEQTAIAFGFTAEGGAEPEWRDTSFLRLKGDCEALLRDITGRESDSSPGARFGFHPGKTGRVSVDGREVGTIGGVDPRLSKAFGLERNAYVGILDVAALPAYETPRYRLPSKFPSTYRDVALVVDLGVGAREIERAVAGALGAFCTGVRVFDEYRGPQIGAGCKSLAVRITMARFDTTITDEEADAAVAAVADALRRQFGATIRA